MAEESVSRYTVAWDVEGDPHELYEEVEGITLFETTDCKVVHCDEEDADAVEERLRAAGANPTGRRRVAWLNAPPPKRTDWVMGLNGWEFVDLDENRESGPIASA